MKRVLLGVLVLCTLGLNTQAQCDPNPLYVDSLFGVWPDTATNFPPAVVNELYNTQLDLKVPSNASQVPGAGLPPLPIDSASVDDVMGLPAGLSYQCASQTDGYCTFLGGALGCAVLTGTPTEIGVFDLVIQVTAYLNLVGSVVEGPLDFEGYRVAVAEDGTTSIQTVESFKPKVSQNSPNPFQFRTEVNFTLMNAHEVEFIVMDLLGQEVYSETIEAVRGENTIEFEPEGLESGIYMYALRSPYGTVTRRMVYDRP
ncbi:MAG: T9SS type A sorting domain-containing protein [Flavobacteriales bacterium]|nr:T9SS type A sorting domain-containing protein [Flavobacteriales bacterium]